MICKFCGNENPDEFRNCCICGKELQNTLLNSLVMPGADNKIQENAHAMSGVAKKGFEDTGGGAASGPQFPAGNKIENKENNTGSTIATAVAVIVIVAVFIYFLCFTANAPLAGLFG